MRRELLASARLQCGEAQTASVAAKPLVRHLAREMYGWLLSLRLAIAQAAEVLA